jgi:hypothetical protein
MLPAAVRLQHPGHPLDPQRGLPSWSPLELAHGQSHRSRRATSHAAAQPPATDRR